MGSVFRALAHRCVARGPQTQGVEAVAELLQQSYDGDLVIEGCCRAPSEWWRSELEFLRRPKPERWAVRTYIFEKMLNGRSRYVGFAHVRPPVPSNTVPVIADAFLAPPWRMMTGDYRFPCLSELSSGYGGALFACLPYVMPARDLGGFCAHACVSMAMLAMTPHGGRPMPPFDMTVWLALRNIANKWGPAPEKPLRVGARGLRPEEMVAVVNRGDSGLAALHLEWRRAEVGAYMTLIRQHVGAGLPVMLHVDFSLLYPDRPCERGFECHAVLVIGLGQTTEGGTTFVYHDPVVGPYLETTSARLGGSLFWFPCSAQQGSHVPVAVAVAPAGVTLSLRDCHAENGGTTRDWRAELVARPHFHRRLSRLATSGFSPHEPRWQRYLVKSLEMLLPTSELPAYSWLLLRSAANAEPSYIAFLYDAGAGRPRRIAAVHFSFEGRQRRVTVQEGKEGYGRCVYEDGGQLKVVEVDQQGKEII